jgi:hypothetical protein
VNKYTYLLILFCSFEAFAVAKVNLKFLDAKVKQGSLVDAVIGLNSETTQKIQYNQLKGQTLGGSFYIYHAKPLMTKGGWDSLESEAKVIVVKIPENKPLLHKLQDKEFEVSWDSVEFIPTETPKEMIFGQFEIPSRSQIIKWFLIILGIAAVVGLGYFIFNKLQGKKNLRKKRAGIKSEVTSATDYSHVVSLWQKKAYYLSEFPHLEEPFKKLELVLFKYQFKQSQSEAEKTEVMNAYREFVNDSQGGFSGI